MNDSMTGLRTDIDLFIRQSVLLLLSWLMVEPLAYIQRSSSQAAVPISVRMLWTEAISSLMM